MTRQHIQGLPGISTVVSGAVVSGAMVSSTNNNTSTPNTLSDGNGAAPTMVIGVLSTVVGIVLAYLN